MGLYVSFEDVRIRLIGKVRFTRDPEDDNKMHEDLANRLIAEAEGQVELDLSPRYFAPFQTIEGLSYRELPDRPTRNIIRTLCEIQSVLMILNTDFGSGTVVEADKYSERLEKRYRNLLADLMKRKTMGGVEAQGFAKPPLPGLKLNYMNEAADDGFMGSVLVTSQGDGDYPQKQINDPSENFWNGEYDE